MRLLYKNFLEILGGIFFDLDYICLIVQFVRLFKILCLLIKYFKIIRKKILEKIKLGCKISVM